MRIINTHDVTLYGSTGEYDIVLRPLCDEHLPLLYKWWANPDVRYWTEGGEADKNISYGADTVHQIYGRVSQTAYCFLIECNGVPIGECRLQEVNLPDIKIMYPEALDVRRIDMSIGEKDYWDSGIGTRFIGMMVDFAFTGEHVDVLHCVRDDCNVRSRCIWEKHGFTRIRKEAIPNTWKGTTQYHYRLTRDEFTKRRRYKVSPEKTFELSIKDIQPSQLYVSDGKLHLVQTWFDPADKSEFDPIPVKLYNGRYLMTDGHTRVAAAILAGWKTIPVTWDNDPMDMLAYAQDVRWCKEHGIESAMDLAGRIVAHKDYEILWRKRCHEMVIAPSYAAIVARFGALDGRNSVILLTDNEMEKTALLIQNASAAFVKNIKVINLDTDNDYGEIYALAPDDLLILHIGMASWMGRHKAMAHAFSKPAGVVSKYICIRPTVTPQALLEGLDTPEELTARIISQYGALPSNRAVRVTAKNGTDLWLTIYDPWVIPHTTHTAGATAYLPPAEISYSVMPGLTNGTIVADVTVGELRVYADLIDGFGLIDEPVSIQIVDGMIVDITGGAMAKKLKAQLLKLPDSCRKVVELGVGLARMSPSGTIGIDESIAGTCHFGFGNGSGNDAPIHLDVVVNDFFISLDGPKSEGSK